MILKLSVSLGEKFHPMGCAVLLQAGHEVEQFTGEEVRALPWTCCIWFNLASLATTSSVPIPEVYLESKFRSIRSMISDG